jgi:tetratricopeptide (TPR) repeat protein
VLFAIASALPLLLFFVTGRYRLPILPVLALFAAYAVVWGFRSWRVASRRRRFIVVGVGLLILVVSRIDFYGYATASEAQGDHMMASIYRQKGDLARAEYYYRTALAADSMFPHANNDLGLLLLERGNNEEALKLLRRAVASGSDDYLLQYNLGVAHLRAGNTDSAIAKFREVLDHVPNYYDAANNLGRAWLEAGQPDSALAAYRIALEAAPDFPPAYYAVGYSFERTGQTDSALAYYDLAVQRDDRYLQAYYAMGMIWRDRGVADSAEFYLQRFVDMSPGAGDLEARVRLVLDSLRTK